MTQAIFELSNLTPTSGFTINGIAAGDGTGVSVAAGGDINGDGTEDIIIGAYFADPGEKDKAGRVYVIFDYQGIDDSFELSSLDGSNGFMINGIAAGDRTGISVSSGGDVNNDGYDDIIIGAPYASPNGKSEAGQAYVTFGAPSFDSVFESSNINSTTGFIVNGLNAGDRLGNSVLYVGDFNGDDIDDIMIGAPLADPGGRMNAGQVYVVFGSSSLGGTVDLSELGNEVAGITINGVAQACYLGWRVAEMGDFDEDGSSDIILGSRYSDQPGEESRSSFYIVLGKSNYPAVLELSSFSSNDGFIIKGPEIGAWGGVTVASGSDVNGDGKPDIIVNAFTAEPSEPIDEGEVYVIFGSSDFDSIVDINNINGTNGVTIVMSTEINGEFRVASIGDINSDGKNDILIGNVVGDPNGRHNAGRAYVIYGQESFSPNIAIADIDSSTGFIINGEVANDNAGCDVAKFASSNDIMIGALWADPDGRENAGQVYILHAEVLAEHFASTINCTALSEVPGIFIQGNLTMTGVVNIGIAGEYGLQFTNGILTSAYDAQEACEAEEILYIASPDGSGEIAAADCVSNCTDPEVSVPAYFSENFCIRDDLGVMRLVAELPDGFGC